jgi:hypothetical protein
MDSLGIELPWMLTVVGVMFAYGVVSLIGVFVKKNAKKDGE